MKLPSTLNLLFFGFIFLPSWGYGNSIRPEELLAQIPGKKLTVDFILKKAIQSSKTFESIEAEKWSSNASFQSSKQYFDWTLYGEARKLKNSFETVSPASPSSTDITSYQFGVKTFLPTGTAADVKFGNSLQDFRFSSALFQVPKTNEAKISFTLTQKLLSDSFGASTRALSQSQEITAKAKLESYQYSKEEWAVQLISQFYAAWRSQRLLQIAEDNLKRRQTLVNSTKLRLNRGTAERPDLLQAEAAYLLSKDSVLLARAELQSHWRTLLRFLDLPAELESYPAEKIPMELDEPTLQAEQICLRELSFSGPKLKQAELEVQAAEQAKNAALNRAKPELNLFGSMEWNGIESQSTGARSEALQGKHPAWAAGILFELPLGNHQKKAEIEMARAQWLAAEGRLEAEQDASYLRFRKNCEDWSRQKLALRDVEEAFLKQRQRLTLEERRFQLGRVNLFQLIQAGDDLSSVESTKVQQMVQWRQLSWAILRESPKMSERLESWEGRNVKAD